MSATARLAWALIVALVLCGPGHAAEPPSARPQVGKPVQEAQALIKQKKYAAALAKLREAEAVGGLSSYEAYIVEETRAAATLDSGDESGAVKALEAVVATGFLPPAEAAKRVATIVELDYRLKDYPKTVDAAQRYYKLGGADREPRLLMVQALYLENDFPAAIKAMRELLEADGRAGKAADENLLLMLVSSALKTKDDPLYREALERLVASHPKPQYWSDLISATVRKSGFAPRLALDVDRLEVATGAMTAADSFIDAAELALEQGFPGDAKSFLDKGYAIGALGAGAAATRQKRLADMAARQSAEDQKSLPQLAKEADSAKTGLPWVKLGEAYLSYGRPADAMAALQKGLAKGGLDHPEDARLHLGMAALKAGDAAKAKATLEAVAGADGTRDLGLLWLIEGGLR